MRFVRLPIAALMSAGLLFAGVAPAADPPPFETPNAPKKESPSPGPPAFDVDSPRQGAPAPPPSQPSPPAPPAAPPSLPAEDRVPSDLPEDPSPPSAPAPPPPSRIAPMEGGDATPAAPSRPVKAAPAAPRVVTAAPPKPAPKKKSVAVKARSKAGKRAARASTGGSAATYPGFRLLEGGGSRVFVKVEGKIAVTERRGAGQLVVALPGVSVPSRNDRRPLDTSFFPTPVSQVRLVPHEGGADLVIELKQPSSMQLRVEDHRDGVVIMIDFPALSGGSSGALR